MVAFLFVVLEVGRSTGAEMKTSFRQQNGFRSRSLAVDLDIYLLLWFQSTLRLAEVAVWSLSYVYGDRDGVAGVGCKATERNQRSWIEDGEY